MRWLFALLLFPGLAWGQHVTGPLQAQNNLKEIATNGSAAQQAAQVNLGLGATPGPFCPLTGCAYTGTVNFTGLFKIAGVTQVFPGSGLLVGTTDSQALTSKTYNGLGVTATTGTLTVPNGTTFTTPPTSDTGAGLGTANIFAAVNTFNLGEIVPSSRYDATAFGSCTWDGAITHDVQPCLQAAINAACAANAAEVDVPAGILPLGSDVLPTCGLTIQGRGVGVSVFRAMPGNSSNPLLFGLASISNFTFRGVSFDGGASGGATATPASVFIGSTFGSSTTLTAATTSSTNTATAGGQFLYCTGCTAPVRIISGTFPTFTLSQAVTIASGTVITGVTPGMQGSIATNALTLFGTVSAAPLAVGDTVYWNGGSAVIQSGSGLNWLFTTSPGTVSFRPMFAGPGANTGLVPLVTLFNNIGTTFDNVGWQHAAGLGLNVSGGNTQTVTNSQITDIGNRWKATLSASDRIQGIVFCCGDGSSEGFDNSVTDSYFADIGLDPVDFQGNQRTVLANNRFNLQNNQVAQVSTAAYGGVFFNGSSATLNLMPPREATITGNTITGAQGSALDTQGLQRSTITGNSITKSGGAGIGVFSGAPSVITASMTTSTATVTAIASGILVNGQAVGSVGATAIAPSTYITNIGTCGGASPTLPCTFTYAPTQNVGSETMHTAFNAHGLTISGNAIANNVQVSGASFIGGVTIDSSVPDDVTISANTITDDQTTKTQKYGIAITTQGSNPWTVAPTNLQITSNNLAGNLTGAIDDTSLTTSKVISLNIGLDSVIPSTITAASTLTLPLNPLVKLTGTTTVTTIGAICWTGRVIEMISASATPFTATNNIANAVTTTANVPITATCDGTNWFLR